MSIGDRGRAWATLLRRYGSVLSYFWSQRKSLALPALLPHEAEFLPAALAIQAKPISPFIRWTGRILVIMITALLAWSWLGRVDIVIDGQGKIRPVDRTKLISAAASGRIKAIHVRDGQQVKAGDVLLELDAGVYSAEGEKAQGEWLDALLQADRARRIIRALASGALPPAQPQKEIDASRWKDADRQTSVQWAAYQARQAALQMSAARHARQLQLATQQAQDYKDLYQSSDIARHAWQEKEQRKMDLEGQIREVNAQMLALLEEARKSAEDSLDDALKRMSFAESDRSRAFAQSDLMRLVTPVDGVVEQLAVHTVGAAVSAAAPLMQIVPADGPVEIESFLENKDVGFVREGQQASVKIDAFDYTKYGAIPAKIVRVSRDAVQDERRGPIYSVIVEMERAVISVDGREVSLSPGMSARVDIKTGPRRMIDYFLSPLLKQVSESLHEK